MNIYSVVLLTICALIIIVYLAVVIHQTPGNIDKFEGTVETDSTQTQSTKQETQLALALSRTFKVRFVEPRTCYAYIDGKERYRMQSYQQLFEYWFPGMTCELVKEDEPADIAVIGNSCSDNSALRPNEVNIFISIENVPRWNQYPHYSKYGDYNDPLIDIFVY